ncbi:hypothetical protein BDY21DRAFT_367828 [Lineolata rhizophorae]|uniref:F-box domain-containing protein n=1 Tax=Lineolata rhizophorae TaxID=578093 RepID=A0A6A6NL16_9PEZI|nr:hypothetical protein BDY21DRAFT_367828 [Lineolata rhizophorae]
MAFNVLPLELNVEIAKHLESDKDVAAFGRTCKWTSNVVHSTSPYWRLRYRQLYDLPIYPHERNISPNARMSQRWAALSNTAIRARFASIASLLRRPPAVCWRQGTSTVEVAALSLLTQLINDSCSHTASESMNITFVTRYALRSQFLHPMLLDPTAPAYLDWHSPDRRSQWLQATRLVFASLLMDRRFFQLRFFHQGSLSQMIAYQPPATASLFLGPYHYKVNSTYALAVVNFYSQHLDLPVHNLHPGQDPPSGPFMWSGKINKTPLELPRVWRGSCGYICEDSSELDALRRGDMEPCSIVDKTIASEYDFMTTLILEFFRNPNRVFWPPEWRDVFDPVAPREPPNNLEPGFGPIGQPYHFAAWDEHWGQVGRVKPYGTYHIDHTDWVFEGVITPGGEMIIGRWFGPTTDDDVLSLRERLDVWTNLRVHSGPMIYWSEAFLTQEDRQNIQALHEMFQHYELMNNQLNASNPPRPDPPHISARDWLETAGNIF